MEPKPIYKSRTLWFNVIVGAVTIFAGYMVGDIDKAKALEQAGPVLLVLGNVVLRLITKQPIG